MKIKRRIVMFVVLAMLVSQSAWAQSSYDFENHWANEYIQRWMEKEWIRGYGDGSVMPDRMVTRAEFVVMANRMFGFSEKADIGFSDVKSSDWFYDEVAKAVSAGYLKGYEDGTLRPNSEISRQEAMSIIYGILQGQDLTEDGSLSTNIVDYDAISDWARGPVVFGFIKGIVSGYAGGYFMPQRSITRAEAIAMFERTNEYMQREREREQEQEQEQEREQEQKDGEVRVPESSSSYRAVYIIDKWIAGGDVYVEFEEYNEEGVFEVRIKDLDFSEVDEQRPYIVRIRRSEMELIKDASSSRFDVVYGIVTEKSGDVLKVDKTPSDGEDGVVILNAGGARPVVYQEDDKKGFGDIDEGDYVLIITEDTVRPRVIEILTQGELNEDRGKPPYEDEYYEY